MQYLRSNHKCNKSFSLLCLGYKSFLMLRDTISGDDFQHLQKRRIITVLFWMQTSMKLNKISSFSKMSKITKNMVSRVHESKIFIAF